MAFEPSVDPNNVRGAIDTSFDTNDLSGDVISLSIYTERAIEEVKRRDPLYATRDAEQAQRLNRAAEYLCAAYLLPAIPNLTREAFGDDSYQREPKEVEKDAARLLGLAESELSEVLSPGDSIASMPTMFALAKGRRGL